MFFCNRECQAAVWKRHKHACQRIAKRHVAPAESSSSTCLIVDGMGGCGAGWDYMKNARREMLDAGVNVIVIDVYKCGDPTNDDDARAIEQVIALLETNNETLRPDSMLMLGWGGGEREYAGAFARHEQFQETVTRWCRHGGRFMVQGEGAIVREWAGWFDKEWSKSCYYRTDHKCGADGPQWCTWYKSAPGAITGRYNVKAVMLKGVSATDALFSTTEESSSYSLVPIMRGQPIGAGHTAIALAEYGSGTVSFFGDVNHEDSTVRIMAVIARGDRS